MSVNQTFLRLMLLAVSGTCVSNVSAQQDTSRILIRGLVIDPLRHPIEGVELRIEGSDLAVTTASDGTFRLLVPRAPRYLLRARRPGYNAQVIEVFGAWNGTIMLEPGSFRLPDVQVTARNAKPAEYAGTTKYDEYFRRRRMGIGEFVDRHEIEQRNALHTSDLFQGRAGIKVATTSINGTLVTFARCNEYPPKINVYVDGHKLIPERADLASRTRATWESTDKDPVVVGMVGEMLGRIDPSDIEFIEIFRGPGELPAEFNDGNCGAIAIWTRHGGR